MPRSSSSATATPAMTEASEKSTPHSSPPPATNGDSNKMAVDAKSQPSISETMEAEEKKMQAISQKEEEKRNQRLEKERKKDIQGGKGAVDQKFKALEYLLSQSKLYSTIMLSQMQKQEEQEGEKDEKERKRAQKREEQAEQAAQVSQRKSTRHTAQQSSNKDADSKTEGVSDASPHKQAKGRPPKKTQGKMGDYFKKEELESKAGKGRTIQDALEDEAVAQENEGVQPGDIGVQNLKSARQPDLVTGGMMRSYQLEGLEWLTSLYENGLNGILADEMGLGKTIQTISFLAFLREKGTYGPFLIAAPLSTTSNWVDEFQRWTPDIPVLLYHGSKQEREELRQKRLRNPGSASFPVICTSYEICMNDRKHLAHFGWKFIIIDEGHRIKNLNCRLIRELQSYQSANRLLITGTPLQNNLAELWSLLHFLMPEIFDKLESFESWFDFSALQEEGGHERLFTEERKSNLVTSLHAILKPFLLRRVKADVEHSMPKKREYVLFAPLTTEQRELYREILHGNSRAYLEDKVVESLSRAGSRNASGTATPNSVTTSASTKKRKAGPSGLGSSPMPNGDTSTPNKSAKTSRESSPGGRSSGRKARKRNYEEISDAAFFKKLSSKNGKLPSEIDGGSSPAPANHNVTEDEDATERAATLALAKKQIAQKKLQNPVMQLRLCCNSPHNFYDPWLNIPEDVPDSEVDYTPLTSASGKIALLDRLLCQLLDDSSRTSNKSASKRSNKAAQPPTEPHKILLFSQFKSTLDILALYIDTHLVPKGLTASACRIDGSVAAADRANQIRQFHSSPTHKVFLLSTRAGGQGINLAAADTVILFDSDWNPQQDLQAQDRAHRIGQRRNVIVYRLATRGTIEEVLLGRAGAKRRLEKLVISKGKFRDWGHERSNKSAKSQTALDEDDDDDTGDGEMAELQRALAEADGERLDFGDEKQDSGKNGGIDARSLLSDADLATLTDRSDEAYARAERNGQAGDEQRKNGAAGRPVFESVVTRKGDDGLLEGLTG